MAIQALEPEELAPVGTVRVLPDNKPATKK